MTSNTGDDFVEVANSPEFQTLRRTLRRFVFPATAVFLLWYALYVLLSAFARSFMSTKVIGHINIALIFGLLQFVSTFVIAWLYARYADRQLDPLAANLRAKVEAGPAGAASLPESAPESLPESGAASASESGAASAPESGTESASEEVESV
jgi:uncharacterized membrane protein (DUF485 family)